IGGLASNHKLHANAVPAALAVQPALSNADRLPALADNEVAVPSLAATLCTICPVRCVPFLGEQSCAGQDPVQLAPLDVAMLIQRGRLPAHDELAGAEYTAPLKHLLCALHPARATIYLWLEPAYGCPGLAPATAALAVIDPYPSHHLLLGGRFNE